MKAIKNILLLVVGGAVYCGVELLFRGFTHWSMGIVGGLCFWICGQINEGFSMDMLVWEQMAISAVLITMTEFISGCILNLCLGLAIWDYSNIPLNLLGQICLPFSMAWFILSLPAIVLDDYLRYWYFDEEKPSYRWK